MYELDHPHVMKFREWYETTNHLWLVMDLCDGMTRHLDVFIDCQSFSYRRWFIEIDHPSRWIFTREFYSYDRSEYLSRFILSSSTGYSLL